MAFLEGIKNKKKEPEKEETIARRGVLLRFKTNKLENEDAIYRYALLNGTLFVFSDNSMVSRGAMLRSLVLSVCTYVILK